MLRVIVLLQIAVAASAPLQVPLPLQVYSRLCQVRRLHTSQVQLTTVAAWQYHYNSLILHPIHSTTG